MSRAQKGNIFFQFEGVDHGAGELRPSRLLVDAFPVHHQGQTSYSQLNLFPRIKSEHVWVMADVDSSSLSAPAQEKLVWVNPQIVVMLAHESFAKISNPREGGNSTEGFIGPSWDFKGNPPTIQSARPSLSRQISLSTWSWPILLLLLLLSVKMI